jgi:hypothetical protein
MGEKGYYGRSANANEPPSDLALFPEEDHLTLLRHVPRFPTRLS